MKILIIAIIALFAASMLCMPYEGSGEAPLEAAAVAVLIICAIALVFRGVLFMLRLRHALRKKGYRIRASRLLFGVGYIAAESKSDRYLIRIVARKKKNCTMHFETPETVQYFKTTRMIARGIGGFGATYSNAYTRSVGQTQLPTPKGFRASKSFVVVDKFNQSVTDSQSKAPLSNGDRICGSETLLYNDKAFLRAID